MIRKGYRKFTGLVAWVALLSFMSPVIGQAAPGGLGGSPIPATPFDHKLIMAGGLETPLNHAAGSLKSSDSLFMQARSIRYVKDPGSHDDWQTPEETQARWAGDCEDKAVWLFAQLKANGYSNVRLVVGRYRLIDKNYHVWVTLADNHGNIFILDPTTQKKVWGNSSFGENQYKTLYSFDGMNRYRHDN